LFPGDQCRPSPGLPCRFSKGGCGLQSRFPRFMERAVPPFTIPSRPLRLYPAVNRRPFSNPRTDLCAHRGAQTTDLERPFLPTDSLPMPETQTEEKSQCGAISAPCPSEPPNFLHIKRLGDTESDPLGELLECCSFLWIP